ncbi:LPXTG cell wall anchor domain-containing protein [Furfurilactobacillus rossiae]|uniref:LPXTG cell wall anchor domain-containing protein n=1 Tax=Furfurilactobacillus rossiae TaxID=231049 RepID=UPI0017805D6D|nr:LPXTG cell wall anchor domain-containing protein [Furfurilactobacillus rossiae]
MNITKPTKEVVANTTDPTNIDGKSFALNTNFDYEVDSSTRPANYAGITESWTGSDYLDIKHDQYNGQTKIVTTQDITLDNGSVIKAGQDITNYFYDCL